MELFSSGKRLMNHETTVVSEALLSSTVTNPSVAVMDFGNVVVRRDYQTYNKVKLISGGGTGHQPAYAGYVGPGMLTAAVHGEPVVSINVRFNALRMFKKMGCIVSCRYQILPKK